jgi:hypothetical protein
MTLLLLLRLRLLCANLRIRTPGAAVFVQPHLLSIFLSDDSTRRNQPAHEAGSVAAFLVPDENRSVAIADVFVDGEMEARKQRPDWLEIGE